jgi:hypothetical protein
MGSSPQVREQAGAPLRALRADYHATLGAGDGNSMALGARTTALPPSPWPCLH